MCIRLINNINQNYLVIEFKRCPIWYFSATVLIHVNSSSKECIILNYLCCYYWLQRKDDNKFNIFFNIYLNFKLISLLFTSTYQSGY